MIVRFIFYFVELSTFSTILSFLNLNLVLASNLFRNSSSLRTKNNKGIVALLLPTIGSG